jgi:hypothetical protein
MFVLSQRYILIFANCLFVSYSVKILQKEYGLFIASNSCVIFCLPDMRAIFTGEICLIFLNLSIFSKRKLSEIFAQSCRYIYGRNRSIRSQKLEDKGQKQNNRVSESRCPVGSGYQKGRRIWWQDI